MSGSRAGIRAFELWRRDLTVQTRPLPRTDVPGSENNPGQGGLHYLAVMNDTTESLLSALALVETAQVALIESVEAECKEAVAHSRQRCLEQVAQVPVQLRQERQDLLVEEHELSLAHRGHVIEAVVARERMMSTGMEFGVAIPHGAVAMVDDVVAAVGISDEGIDFQAIDGKLTHIIILLVLPASKYSSSVMTMAAISRIMTNEELRDRVRHAASPGAVMAALTVGAS